MKVVTLTTFPFAEPRHGGQQRMHSIVEAYRNAGHEVRSAGVLGSMLYPAEPGFIRIPTADELSVVLPQFDLMEDWTIGQLVANDDVWFDRLASAVGEPPDVFHVEHPWLFAFARRYRDSIGEGRTYLLYGSANVEHALKRTIVAGYMGEDHARRCETLVLRTELDAVQQADSCCAVSTGDQAWLERNGATTVILAPNGVRIRHASRDAMRRMNLVVGHHRNALYCASAHPPNIVGFYDMFQEGLGCLAPDQRLVVVGSAGRAIQADARFGSVPGLGRHFVDAGEVDEDALQALIHCAHVMLLPITQGGGTNLKTAEALWSGHRVVATPSAMRGFEGFSDAAGVAVCQDAAAFRHKVREQMQADPLVISEDERRARRAVTWEATLGSLVDHVNSIEGTRHA